MTYYFVRNELYYNSDDTAGNIIYAYTAFPTKDQAIAHVQKCWVEEFILPDTTVRVDTSELESGAYSITLFHPADNNSDAPAKRYCETHYFVTDTLPLPA